MRHRTTQGAAKEEEKGGGGGERKKRREGGGGAEDDTRGRQQNRTQSTGKAGCGAIIKEQVGGTGEQAGAAAQTQLNAGKEKGEGNKVSRARNRRGTQAKEGRVIGNWESPKHELH